jgi:hypothetical protein
MLRGYEAPWVPVKEGAMPVCIASVHCCDGPDGVVSSGVVLINDDYLIGACWPQHPPSLSHLVRLGTVC